MSKVERFEDLEVWQKSIALAKDIYKLSNHGRLSKDYGMKDQIRRAACSISNNIAEGFENQSNKQMTRFLYIAKGSCGELRSQIYLMSSLDLITNEEQSDLYNKCIEISKMLAGFIKYLQDFETTTS